MTPPSKELLSAVFGKKIGKIEIKGVYLEYEHWENCINHQKQDISGYDITRINIYELAFRVKEWALTKGLELSSHIQRAGDSWCIIYDNHISQDSRKRVTSIIEDTEPEAIFAAGEWVLNQQNKGM